MKNSDIQWSNIQVIETVSQKTENVNFRYSNDEVCIFDINVQYDVLKYTDNTGHWYMVFGKLPYNFKSAWRKTKIDSSNSLNIFKSLLNSNLKQKYENIKLRDYNYRLFLDSLQQSHPNVSVSAIYNKPHYEKEAGNAIGDIYYSLEVHNRPAYAGKITEITNQVQFNLSWSKFVKMMLQDSCYYCGISIQEINELNSNDKIYTKRARGSSMEIDQKDPFGFYTDMNCVATCYWCNNAKTDEFTCKEFKENIAPGIRKIWEARLNKDITSNNELDKNCP